MNYAPCDVQEMLDGDCCNIDAIGVRRLCEDWMELWAHGGELSMEITKAEAENATMRELLEQIAYHGCDMPSAANYTEAEWWQKVAYDCMRIAASGLKEEPCQPEPS